MDFKYSTVYLSPREMYVAGRIDSVTNLSVPYILHKDDIDSLVVDFQEAVHDRDLLLGALKKNRHLGINTERVFMLRSDKIVAQNALHDIAERRELLEKRRQERSQKLHTSLFIEPPIDYDELPDPAS